MANEYDEQLRRDVAAWLEAKAKRREAWELMNRHSQAYQDADRKADSLLEKLAPYVGKNVPSVLCRVPATEVTVVIQHHEGWKTPVVSVFGRDGQLIQS